MEQLTFETLRTIDVHTNEGDLIEIALPDVDATHPELANMVSVYFLCQNKDTTFMNLEDLEALKAGIETAINSIKCGF